MNLNLYVNSIDLEINVTPDLIAMCRSLGKEIVGLRPGRLLHRLQLYHVKTMKTYW